MRKLLLNKWKIVLFVLIIAFGASACEETVIMPSQSTGNEHPPPPPGDPDGD